MKIKKLKYMASAFALIASLGVYSGLTTASIANAGNTATQTIIISVAPIRALYLDSQNNITHILNNTPTIAEERLQVFKGGVEIPMSDEIRQQYNSLLSTVDWNKCGVYKPETNYNQELDAEQSSFTEENNSEKMVADAISNKIICPIDKIHDAVSKLNLQPDKEDYIIRTTVYENPEGTTDISVEYLPPK